MHLTKQTWRKIRREYKNSLSTYSAYICVRSATFTSLWMKEKSRQRIRREAENFLANSKYSGMFDLKMDDGQGPLFYRIHNTSDKYSKSVRLAFVEHMINTANNGKS